MSRNAQNTNSLLMIKPKQFYVNTETAPTNTFQQTTDLNSNQIQSAFNYEFNHCVELLKQNNIEVILIESEVDDTPDALFPNNWVTLNHDGTVFYYPMLAQNRRRERMVNIISHLKNRFIINEEVDFSNHELKGCYLEGTGSIVFDHVNRFAFAALSERTNQRVLEDVCSRINYSNMVFSTLPINGVAVYHTNVCLHIGSGYVIIAEEVIQKDDNYIEMMNYFHNNSFEVIKISKLQMEAFAGNMLQVKSKEGENLLLMSTSAFSVLSNFQISTLQRYNRILCFDIPTIEKVGGGSIRCMLAEIFLPTI